MIEVFGIAFSIMGLLPSIASTLAFSIPAGPLGMVWGWFLASGCIFVVGVAMADLGSAMPTSGGLYWWYVETLGCGGRDGIDLFQDALLCLAKDQKRSQLSSRILEHTWSCRWIMQYRLRTRAYVLFCVSHLPSVLHQVEVSHILQDCDRS